MTLSIKDRLGARICVGQVMSFARLFKIMKSLGHTLYIAGIGATHIDHIDPFRCPRYVRIVEIFERENQIWSMGEMIMATFVKIEGVN